MRRPWRTPLTYMLVALAAAATNVAIERLGQPAWSGYVAAAVVIVAVIGGLEWRRAVRSAGREPDLKLLRSEVPRDAVLERLRALERAGRPKAGVGVAIPPGDCKLWIRHAEAAFEIHAFSVSAADAPRFSRIEEVLKLAPGLKPVLAVDRPGRVLTFRATLSPESVHRLVMQLLDLEPAPGASVQLWWSTTLGELPT